MSDASSRRLRAALLQLPVPDPRPEASRSNVPLAPGYLAASSRKTADALLAPRLLQDHGGDSAILAWLEEVRPDVVGFTTFLWNMERNLWLARETKRRLPGVTIVMGGPEVAAGSPLLGPAAPEVDVLVTGEGERVWPDILRSVAEGRRPPRRISAPPADTAALANPYLAGALEARPGDSIFLETVRGCTRRCDYCYYAKASPALRPLRADIASTFSYARDRGVADLYVMDPCFNASADFRDKLEEIAAANRTRIPLHTELELEAVDAEVADLLARAGFVSVEAGLQSTNRDALRAVHRGWRRQEFIRGGKLLRRRGIEIRTGIILGLPRDTMDGFLGTIAFAKDHGFADGLELYPLSVLPGTGLRSRAASLGLAAMRAPPYWVLSNGSMREPDFVEAIRIAEAALDIEFFQPVLPRFHDPSSDLLGVADLRAPGSAEHLLRGLDAAPERLASHLSLLVSGPEPAQPEILARIGRRVTESSPHTMTRIVVDCPGMPPYPPWDRVADAFYVPGHYLDRIHYYATDPQGRFSVRLAHLTADPAVAERYYTDPEAPPFDLLLRYSRALAHAEGLLDRLPPLLVETGLKPEEQESLARRYRGLESLIVYRES